MGLQKRSLYLGLLLMLASPYVSGKEKAEEQGRPILNTSADRSLISSDASSPVDVKLTFTVRGAKPMQGSYSWLVTSTGDWRRELTLSDYSDFQVGRGSTVWVKRTLDFEPLQAIWAEAVIENLPYLNYADDVIEKYFTASEHRVDLRCLDLLRDKKPRTLCFDPEGNLARADVKELNVTFEYSDYHAVGHKFLPYQVILKREGKPVLEGTIESIAAVPKPDQNTFEPPANAIKQAGCFSPALPKIAKKVVPQYPEAARNSRKQGTVTIFATILSDGSVHNAQVIQTAGKELDEASLSAIRLWQYTPARCGNVPIDYDTAISVNYSLQAR